MDTEEKRLDWLFGKDSKGNTEIERAMTSTMLFVRSQDHLALHKPEAKGLVMTAFDVYTIFGVEVIEEVYNRGNAIIVKDENEPALSIMFRRERDQMTQEELAEKAGVTIEEVEDAENLNTRTDMVILCKICLALNIDPKKISWISFG